MKNCRGTSLLEILVVVTMIAVLTAVGVSTFRASASTFEGSVAELVGDIRLARTFAQSRGAHYRIRVVDETRYAIERLRREADGTWAPVDADRRTKTLDVAVRLWTEPGFVVEFDTRGNAVGLARPQTLALEERRTGAVRGAAVWPSGQVIKP